MSVKVDAIFNLKLMIRMTLLSLDYLLKRDFTPHFPGWLIMKIPPMSPPPCYPPCYPPHVESEEGGIDETDKLILAFCVEPRGRQEIAEHIGLKDRKYISYRIKKLVTLGKLRMTDPEKPRSVKQKYVRT